MKASDSHKENMRLFFQNNKDRFAHYAASYRDKLKLEMIEAYGGACTSCGEDDPVVLNLDHINDDAFVEREKYGLNARGGHKHYARLKKEGWPKDRFQLLCCNCNARKEHKRRRDELVNRWGERKTSTTQTRSHAMGGIKVPQHNTSGFKGVHWNTSRGCWQARIMFEGVYKSLGYFAKLREAAIAYKKAALKTWGESANVMTDEEIDQVVADQSKGLSTTKSAEELDL